MGELSKRRSQPVRGTSQLHGIHDRFAFLLWPRFALTASTSRLFFAPDSSARQLCMNELRGVR